LSVILGISGSLRRGSFNTALLNAAKEILPGTIRVGDIHGIPLYDGDLESAGMPEAVRKLQAQLADASGLLLASPEYNSSMPGVLKNAIDWLSRPSGELRHVFRDKPVAVIGATPGAWGSLLAQTSWLTVFRSLGARHWAGGRLLVPSAHHAFDEHGKLIDDEVRGRLEKFVRDFAAFADPASS
jgi:NAD(P)H-dependent FMN reductase